MKKPHPIPNKIGARWSIAGWIVTGLLGALALGVIVVSAHGLLGGSSESRIECDRATGDCRASFALSRQRTARIADIVSAQIETYSRDLGNRAREKQSYIALNLKNAKQEFTPMSADAATVAGYEAAVTQLQTFLAGKEPTLTITINSRWSDKSYLNILGSGILLLLMAVAGFFRLRGHRK